MKSSYRYHGQSGVTGNASQTEVSFAPDSLRQPTFFVGQLKQQIVFREAISALHDVVISDMRFKPKDRTEYKQWLASEEERLLAEFITRKTDLEQKINVLKQEYKVVNKQFTEVMQPYYLAQSKYFKYLWLHDKAAWWVLDPVISVHPDEVFFECFSDDESSYGKLSCKYEVFENISDKAFGTTNIDYSAGLYNEFQKIRDYRSTFLKIDPDGFKISTTDGDEFTEKKIDLPESWVRGFLQVSSAMTLPMSSIDLHPMDVHNICYILRRNRERVGPRSLRFVLTPGKPLKIIFEPWDIELDCPRSIYQGNKEQTIRVWGRRRIHILERLIPIAKKFTLYLLGNGLPSFYVADLGDMTFTLGLSGWSANDWSRMGNFDLLAPRGQVDDISLKRVYKALSETWVESAASLAQRTGLDEVTVKLALAQYSQQGQVLYDLHADVYRIRELSREPLPLSSLRFANEREAKASNFVQSDLVTVTNIESTKDALGLRGKVMDNAVEFSPHIQIDKELRIVNAGCNCHFWHTNKLSKGPCEHMLALRLAHERKTN